KVDRDPSAPAAKPPPMVLDDGVRQDVTHGDQFPRPDGVLEPRQGGLRSQGRPGEGIALEQELVDRIVGQPGGVVAVGVAAGEAKEALSEQFERLMPNLARLAVVRETRGQPPGQPPLGVDPLEQERPTVGAGVRLVEGGDDRLLFRIEVERDLRYTVCRHRASSQRCVETSRHRFYSTCERLGGSSLSSFVNYPG